MNKFVPLIFTLTISSCTAYRVTPVGDLALNRSPIEGISVIKVNEAPVGAQCFEPMLYVLTLGIIPTHCVDTYNVSTTSQNIGDVQVTSMQGWVTLFMLPSKDWKQGSGAGVETEIEEMVRVTE